MIIIIFFSFFCFYFQTEEYKMRGPHMSYLAISFFKAGGTALAVTGRGDGVLRTNKPHV